MHTITAELLVNREVGFLVVFYEILTGLAFLHVFGGKHSMSAEDFEKFRQRRKTFDEAYELAASDMILRVIFRDLTVPRSVILLICIQIPVAHLITSHIPSFDQLGYEATILAILFSPIIHLILSEILPLWRRGRSQSRINK
jgi:hypothetical protein